MPEERPSHSRLPGQLATSAESVADRPQRWPVTESDIVYDGGFIRVREESVTSPSGETLARTVVEHKGATCVVALDEEGRILLLEQYRHPVGRRLVEIPAGILDVDGESVEEAIARELGEEADLSAARWDKLASVYSSPGFTDERVEVYLARDLSPLPEEGRTERSQEEADMSSLWLPLTDAVTAVLDGRISNALAVIGILAAAAAV